MNMSGFLLAAIFFLCLAHPAEAQAGDILKGAKTAIGGGGPSEGEVTGGLKEALQVGTGNAVAATSKLDGYYRNPKIKIPLPGPIQKVEGLLRAGGFGEKVDAFELSMNRAAERAAPEAKAIFWDAIKQMTLTDANKILHGADDEATRYFQRTSSARLGQAFKPIVHRSMSEVGVTRSYQELEERVKATPFGSALNFDLDQYVTDGALEGLFYMLAREEKRIRRNPAARTTELLKKVFGGP